MILCIKYISCSYIYISLGLKHKNGKHIFKFSIFIDIFVLFLQTGERIRVILDCDDNTLAFEKNYEFLGKY